MAWMYTGVLLQPVTSVLIKWREKGLFPSVIHKELIYFFFKLQIRVAGFILGGKILQLLLWHTCVYQPYTFLQIEPGAEQFIKLQA